MPSVAYFAYNFAVKSATLLTGPLNQRQSIVALERIVALSRRDPFARCVILVATSLQARAWQRRLAQSRLGAAISIFTFYQLNTHLLALAGVGVRELAPPARAQILKRLVAARARAGELRHFGAVAATIGFRAALAALIFELKQRRLDEIQFRAATFHEHPKFHDLQLLYEDYQTALRETRTADHEGMGWLALSQVQQRPELFTPLDLLVVDGFDQFSQLQADLLVALAERSGATLITLPLVADQPAYARFGQTAERLRAAFEAAGVGLEEQTVRSDGRRPVELDHLTGQLFELYPAASRTDGEALQLIEAPDRAREARALARHVKQLLRSGARPDEIAVLFYSLEPWAELVREAFAEFEVPLTTSGGRPLQSAPVIVALLRALDAADSRFARQPILDLWASPYLVPQPLSPEQVRLASLLAADGLVTAGRASWRRALAPTTWRRSTDDPHAIPLVNRQDPTTLEALRDALEAFFDLLAPPAHGTARDYARWVERMIGDDPLAAALVGGHGEDPQVAPPQVGTTSLEIVHQVRACTDPRLVARDLAALHTFKQLLRGYAEGAELAGAGTLGWTDFRAELEALVAAASYQVEAPAGVLVATIFEARGVPRRHVLIGGLNEGEFPPPPPPDPLFSRAERAELERRDILLPSEPAARDRAAFLEAMALAGETVTLSRTYLDHGGNLWPPSPFWMSVVSLFEGMEARVERLPLGHVPPLAQVATRPEWLVATAVALRQEQAGATESCRGLLRDQMTAPALAAAIRGQRIERLRERGEGFDRFSGKLADAALVDALRGRLQRRQWSASAFNDLGACGFRFFARRVLSVIAPEEPEEGPDARRLGSIQHEILEHTYRAMAERALPLLPETLGEVESIFEVKAADLLESAPRRHRFHASPLWAYRRREIVRRLRRFLHWEAEQNAARDAPPLPLRVELPFGMDEAPPLVLDAPWGKIEVAGLIDRVDRVGDGLLITDYKSGSSEIPVEDMIGGHNVQMAIYIRAAEQLFGAQGLRVREARFVHLRGPKVSGALDEQREAIEPLVAEAEGALARRLASAWNGDFSVQPPRLDQGRCVRHCEYASMCRVHRGSKAPSAGDGPEL